MKTTSRSPISALWMMPILLLMVACSNDDDAAPDLCAPSTLSVSVETFQLNAYAQPSGGVPPYSLEWSNGATTDSLFNIFPGNYSLTVTDADGCTASTNFQLINFCAGSDLSVTLIASLLSAEAQISGGEPPYSYSWDNGSTDLAIEGLTPGTYTFQVTDQTQCIVVRSVRVGSGCGGVTTVTDVNGRTYETIEIGGQCWMAENLASPTYSNGDPLTTMEEFVWWNNDMTGAYQAFPNDTLNFPDYGFQYNWYAANDPRNVCPTGWHVPTDQEWEVLTNLHGGGTIAGGPLKSIAYWDSPNTGATNSSGFTALPAGETRNMQTGLFVEVGQLGAFWSATDEPGSDFALHLSLSANFATASRFFKDKRNGISIRCLKDE